jgi:phosphorylcholine metabolism protein LicD
MNADQVKTLTKKYIKDVGLYFPEQIEAMKEEKKRVGARKFNIVEYLPFQQWYSRRYTLRLRILGSNVFEEFYELSIANTLKKIRESSGDKYDLKTIEIFHTNIFTNEKTLIPEGTDFTAPDPYPEYIIS